MFGVLGGMGASIVLTESGRISVDAFWHVGIWTAVAAAIWAGLRTPPILDRVVKWGVSIFGLVSLLFAGIPAWGQTEQCVVTMNSSSETRLGDFILAAGRSLDAADTRADTPWTVHFEEGETIEFGVDVDGEVDGTAAIWLESTSPVGFFNSQDTLIWTDRVVGGIAGGRVEAIERSWRFLELSANGVRSQTVPFGSLELEGFVVGDDGALICSRNIYVRLVDQPFNDLVGIGGTVALLVGVAGLFGLARPTERPSDGVLPPPPDGWIEHSSPHVSVESRITDSNGRPLPAGQPLASKTSYRIEVHISPEYDFDEDEEGSPRTVTLHAFGRTFEIPRPTVGIGFGLPDMPFGTIPIVSPESPGDHPLHLAVLEQGQLLHLETVTLPVGVKTGNQETTTRISTTDFGPDALTERTARAAQILLLRASDDSVDVNVLDTNAEPLVSFDTPHQAEALLAAARRVRERLTAALEGSADRRGVGVAIEVNREDLEASLPFVAEAGADLNNLLFGPGKVRQVPGATERSLSGYLPAGSLIQINVDHAGIGVSTIPWGLVYDRPLFLSSESKLCPSFAEHDPDHCPNFKDAGVVCPWGFWGFRYVLEQPPAWSGTKVPPPLTATINRHRPLTVSFTGDPSFPSEEPHLVELNGMADLEVTRTETLSELRAAWQEHTDGFDLVHFFTHHALDPGSGAPALVLGGEYLTENHVNALQLRWTSQPLAFLAGCSTGAVHNLSAPSSLISAFRLAGASGVVGSECTIRDNVAARFVADLLGRLFQGEEVGASLLHTRRDALTNNNSPAGLVYSLYALSDLRFREAPTDGPP